MQTYANDRFHRFAMTPSKTECCIYATEKACENAYANSECTQDAKGCYNPTSCKTDYATSASGCGTSGANGWSVGTKDGNGCGKCSPLTCTDPSSTSYNTVDACKTKLGAPTTTGIKSTTTGKYAGNTACYTCSCTCDSSTYKWEEGEVGGGTLSGQCCNGLYKTCTKNCPAAVTPPANATGVKTTCSDCGETTEIVTSWSCNTGYTKSGNECKKNCTYSSQTSCESQNSGYACSKDSDGCYNPSGCKTGYCKSTNNCISACDADVYKYYINTSAGMVGDGTSCTGTLGRNGVCVGGGTYWTGFKCADGYTKNAAGTGCEKECTYQYDIEHYPNVKQTSQNDSCVRDGVTYYRDICTGNKLSNVSSSLCTTSCYTYQGTAYGSCSCSGALNSVCTGSGYSYSIASSSFETHSAANCGVPGGNPVYAGDIIDSGGNKRYCYTCCR